MGRLLAIGIYVVALVVTVVGVDILIFRHNVWARLLANVGIVLDLLRGRNTGRCDKFHAANPSRAVMTCSATA